MLKSMSQHKRRGIFSNTVLKVYPQGKYYKQCYFFLCFDCLLAIQKLSIVTETNIFLGSLQLVHPMLQMLGSGSH